MFFSEYGSCYNDEVYTITANSCPSTGYTYADVTGAQGYTYTQCFGTDSNDDDNSSDKISPGTLAAIIIPISAVLLGAAVALYYYFVMVPASAALTAPLVSGTASTA